MNDGLDDMVYQYVSCAICGYDDTTFLFNVRGMRLVKCNVCGLVYYNPRLSIEKLEYTYSEEYYNRHILQEDRRRRYYTDRLKEINRYKLEGNLLDVGAGIGTFMEVASSMGWKCRGVEPSHFASNYAREKKRLEVKTGFLEDYHFPCNFFDLLTMWEVLEHTSNPVSILRTAHRILKADGILVISVPNFRSLVSICRNEQELPHCHNFHFTPKTIGLILSKTCFKIVKLNTIAVSGLHANIKSWLKHHGISDNFLKYVKMQRLVYFVLGKLRMLDRMIIIANKG